jgi:hypothetical protein
VNIGGDKITGAHTEHFRNAPRIKRRFEEQIQLVSNVIIRRVRCPVHSLYLCAEKMKLFARTVSWEFLNKKGDEFVSIHVAPYRLFSRVPDRRWLLIGFSLRTRNWH